MVRLPICVFGVIDSRTICALCLPQLTMHKYIFHGSQSTKNIQLELKESETALASPAGSKIVARLSPTNVSSMLLALVIGT